MKIAGDGPHSLGCDSLEVLGLAAATNEMFHLADAALDTEVFSAETFGSWLDIIEAGWRSGVDHITFRTSGSTGTPKRCTHQFAHLRTEVRYLAEMFHAQNRIVALAAAHHIYGFLFTAMLPDQCGLEVAPDVLSSRAGPAHGLRTGDLIVSIPERWQFLERTLTTWPKLVEGVTSTAPCPRHLIASLMERGLHGMTEIYGSSETAGIGTRRWPEDGYRLMPHWKSLPASDSGRSNLIHDSGPQVQLMDQIEFSQDGGFDLAGRVDGLVQVGGTNVSPARIAALLASRPGVADATVRLMRSDEGLRMKALIVPDAESSHGFLLHDLEVWIETHLTVAERPKALTFGPTIPVDSLGRALDW